MRNFYQVTRLKTKYAYKHIAQTFSYTTELHHYVTLETKSTAAWQTIVGYRRPNNTEIRLTRKAVSRKLLFRVWPTQLLETVSIKY
jgi:hypothetical protein